ncbi:Alpha/Beta hydrolase protein [Lyophyllum atratum]|nr:Alpha/Beta hydrolase protein [Lyophyllum atratum]
MVSNPFQCLTLSLLIIPPLLITTYLLAAFPNPPEAVYLHKSLASLPPDAKSWSIYPENFYPGGDYVSLPFGRVRYWLMGPEKGQKVVLIHGLSIPAMIWEDVAPTLASRGYRVLVYDLYGRGYSDAPQTTYDANLYTIQLALLMQHLRWEKAIIAGVSMGGGIATAFTAQFPHLVDDKVVLIACAGLMEASDISRTAKFMSSPLVQTATSSVPVRKYLQRLIMKNTTSVTPSAALTASAAPADKKENVVTEIVRLQSAHLTGYNAALSSSMRDGPIRGQAPSFSSEGFRDRAVLVIHGTKDNTVNPRYGPLILTLLPPATRERSRLITFEGAGHDLTISHHEAVSQAMLEFFQMKKKK